MNLMTIDTNSSNIVTTDLIKYGSVQDIVMATQEQKIHLTTIVAKLGKNYVEDTMVVLISTTAESIAKKQSRSKAIEYLASARGIVTDATGILDNKMELFTPTPVIDAEVLDDPRVKELESENIKLTIQAAQQYEDNLVKQGILKNELIKAEAVLKKLQSGEDVTKALKEAEELRSKLVTAEGKASKVAALNATIDGHREEVANAKTYANTLKREIVTAHEAIEDAKRQASKKSGDALLTYEQKTNAKAHAAATIATEIRKNFTLHDYLIKSGMTLSEINTVTSDRPRTDYTTEDVEAIAGLIYTQRNEITDGELVDKIETLISGALEIVAHAELKSTHSTLKRYYAGEVSAMIADAIADLT